MSTKTLKHTFQSGVADGVDTAVVRPSDWNAEHSLFLGIEAQTGTTYTFNDDDHLSLVTFNNVAAVAATLPQANGSTFKSGWTVFVRNLGAGTATITPTTSTINGAATLVLPQGAGAIIFSDATNYFSISMPPLIVPISNGGTGSTTAAAARTALGLEIGTDVQAQDAELAAIAGLTSAADRSPYFTGSGTAALATFTAAGRALVDDADATAQRVTLGVVIGTNVQAFDADLAAIAAAGLGAGVATFLGTPSSENLAAAVTNETGSGALVFSNSPILVTPNLGTPSFLSLTSATGLPTAGLVDDAVTYAKIQNVAANKLLGSIAGGDVEEIACTAAGRAILDDADAATQRTTMGVIGRTTHGNSNYTLLASDCPLIDISETLTAPRTWTLPLASSVEAGRSLTVNDPAGVITAVNTLTIQRQASDTLGGIGSSGTQFVINVAYGSATFVSNGVSGWSRISEDFRALIATPGQIPGTATNDAAAAGNAGEYQSNTLLVGVATSLSTTTAKTVTSIASLPAGDWDVWMDVIFNPGATTTVSHIIACISSTDNTLDTSPGKITVLSFPSGTVFGANSTTVKAGPFRISLAAAAPIYAIGYASFGTSTMTAHGIIQARRAR